MLTLIAALTVGVSGGVGTGWLGGRSLQVPAEAIALRAGWSGGGREIYLRGELVGLNRDCSFRVPYTFRNCASSELVSLGFRQGFIADDWLGEEGFFGLSLELGVGDATSSVTTGFDRGDAAGGRTLVPGVGLDARLPLGPSTDLRMTFGLETWLLSPMLVQLRMGLEAVARF